MGGILLMLPTLPTVTLSYPTEILLCKIYSDIYVVLGAIGLCATATLCLSVNTRSPSVLFLIFL